MTVIDLITRVDAICKKYEKYDVDKQKDNNVAGDDAFARLYGVVEADLDSALQVLYLYTLIYSLFLIVIFILIYYLFFGFFFLKKSEAVATEKNRATAVAMNAEIRRTKAKLLEEFPKLQRLAFKKVKILIYTVNCDKIILVC